MSSDEQNKTNQKLPYIDESLVINTRLNELERQQREDQKEQKENARHQRITNWLLTIFTGLLFVTSVVSNVLLFRQTMSTKLSADAAKSAAETTNLALHVTQRAYITTGTQELDAATGAVNVYLVNSGHIPSGEAEAVTHEATFNPESPRYLVDMSKPAERHWGRARLYQIPVGGPTIGIAVPVPLFNEAQVKSALQVILIAGTIDYNDGFPDDPIQQWKFCIQTADMKSKKNIGDTGMVRWIPCDPKVVIPKMEKAEHYPENEQK